MMPVDNADWDLKERVRQIPALLVHLCNRAKTWSHGFGTRVMESPAVAKIKGSCVQNTSWPARHIDTAARCGFDSVPRPAPVHQTPYL